MLDRAAAARRLRDAMRHKIEALETVEMRARRTGHTLRRWNASASSSAPRLRRLHRPRLLTIKELAEAADLSLLLIKQIVGGQCPRRHERCREPAPDIKGPDDRSSPIPRGLMTTPQGGDRRWSGSTQK